MGNHAQQRRPERESINDPQSELEPNDSVDQPREKPLREHGVLLHKLRKIVQARRDGQRQEAEADEGSRVADKRKNPHVE